MTTSTTTSTTRLVGAPRVLIASYPRTGSTSLERAFTALMGPAATVLHEPFRRERSDHARNFNTDLDDVVRDTHVLKHHPGNLLSDRQNRLLYRRWLGAGGVIVHLHRIDRVAQARSLAIARALNSYHRAHRVTRVPDERVRAELDDLNQEILHQSAVLSEFPHVEVTYEELFTGDLEERHAAFGELVTQVAPRFATRLADPNVRDGVATALSPSRQTRPERSEAPDHDAPVALVDQVPRFAGSAPLLDDEQRAIWRASISAEPDDQRHGPLPHSPLRHSPLRHSPLRHYGVAGGSLLRLAGGARTGALVDAIATALAEHASLRIDRDRAPIALDWLRYDGDVSPDHDLGLWDQPIDTTELAAHATIVLDEPGSWSGGAVHLAGRGPQPDSLAPGRLFYFSGAIGARRMPVTAGRMHVIAVALPLARDQLLVPGQLLGSDHLFARR